MEKITAILKNLSSLNSLSAIMFCGFILIYHILVEIKFFEFNIENLNDLRQKVEVETLYKLYGINFDMDIGLAIFPKIVCFLVMFSFRTSFLLFVNT